MSRGPNQGMPCPTCGATTKVPDSRPGPAEPLVRRRRRCANGHTFRTIEALLEPKLEHYAVRRSSDAAIGAGRFDEARFARDIRDVLFGHKGPFSAADIDTVVARAIRRIEAQIPYQDLTLTPDEFRTRQDIVGAIPDQLLSGAVEWVLRQTATRPYRMAELLYVMAVRGRVDYRANGMRDAADVFTWIQSRYSHIEKPLRQVRLTPRSPVEVHRTRWRPESVLKKTHATDPFAMHQFHNSLRLALHGRLGADRKATIVAHHVLGDLEGQRVVSSTQLAAGALAALRRVDDIGYLRWATVVKGIGSVRTFAEEAADLIAHPAQPLVWRD